MTPWSLRATRGVWLIALLHALTFADRFLLAPLAPALAATLRLGDAGLGVAMGPAMIVPYACIALLLGGRISPEAAGLWIGRALAGCAAAIAMGALAPSAAVLILSRGLLGAAEAGFDVSALVLLGSAPAGERARGLALFTGSALVGKTAALGCAGLLLGAVHASHIGDLVGPAQSWRLVMACFAVLSGAAALVRLPRFEMQDPASTAQPDMDLSRRSPSWPSYLSLMLPMAAGVFASQGFTAFAPLALVRRFGLSPGHVGTLLGVVLLLAGVVGSQVGGEIAARTRRVGGLVLAAPLACALLAGLIVWRAAQPTLAISAMGAMMLSLSVLAPLGLEQLQRITPPEKRARIIGGYVSAVALIGLGGAPPAIGALSQHWRGPGATMAATCVIVCLATALGTVGAVLLPRPKASQS